MVESLRFDGLIIAISTFIIIGVFHPIVIKGEYYFGTRIWPVFAVLGAVTLIVDLFIQNTIVQAILGVLGCSLFWSIHELFQQKKRVERGWFPKRVKADQKTARDEQSVQKTHSPSTESWN